MNKAFAIAAALSVGVIASPSRAGVVLTQNIVTTSGTNTSTDNRTIMIQGNKQKVVMSNQSIVLDLDGGKMILLNPATKSYTELPFPPTGQMASVMQNMGGVNLDFKKAGAQRTVGGYQCQEYDSSGKSIMGEFTAKGCFSSQAPGADDYSAFTRNLAQKFEAVGMAKTTGRQPNGVPMELETTTKLTNFNIPGMPPEQAERFKQMMANRPPTVTRSTTTSIKTTDLPADTFAVPAGYVERRIGLGGPGGAPAPGPTPYEGE